MDSLPLARIEVWVHRRNAAPQLWRQSQALLFNKSLKPRPLIGLLQLSGRCQAFVPSGTRQGLTAVDAAKTGAHIRQTKEADACTSDDADTVKKVYVVIVGPLDALQQRMGWPMDSLPSTDRLEVWVDRRKSPP